MEYKELPVVLDREEYEQDNKLHRTPFPKNHYLYVPGLLKYELLHACNFVQID